MSGPEWGDRAACKRAPDADAFFPVDATRAARAVRKAVEDRAAAVAVCDQAITAGCGGPAAECLHAEHDQHVFVVTRALMILGLMADPETVRRPPKGFGHPKAAAG